MRLNMKERIKNIKKILFTIFTEEKCSINTANFLEVELDEAFPEDCIIQDFITELALYQPYGGDYLINEKDLIKKCKNIWNYIDKINM